jgi:hypothetical protein
MKKWFIALMFLASTLLFAQDGRTRIDFYNQTSSRLWFTLNGEKACTSDVIPNGTCTEILNAGQAYTPGATNGVQSTQGDSFTAEYGHHYTYTVYETKSQINNTNPYLITVADLDYHAGFAVDAPLTLIRGAATPGTTDGGIAYTQTVFMGSMPNTDIYMVGVGVYPFALSVEDNGRGLEGFRKAVSGTIISQTVVTVSGQPALAAIISAKDDAGRELRMGVLITFKGNTDFIFAFGSYQDVTNTDETAMKLFFTSAHLN